MPVLGITVPSWATPPPCRALVSLLLLLPPVAWHRVQPSQGFQQVSTMMAYAPVLVLVGSVNMEAIDPLLCSNYVQCTGV